MVDNVHVESSRRFLNPNSELQGRIRRLHHLCTSSYLSSHGESRFESVVREFLSQSPLGFFHRGSTRVTPNRFDYWSHDCWRRKEDTTQRYCTLTILASTTGI